MTVAIVGKLNKSLQYIDEERANENNLCTQRMSSLCIYLKCLLFNYCRVAAFVSEITFVNTFWG